MTARVPPEQRRVIILERLNSQRAVDVAGLSAEFGVSPLTIRRDLDLLAAQGDAVRVHGGALARRGRPARTTRPQSIGMVAPGASYYWPEVIAGAQAEAGERGTRLHLRLSQDYGRDTLREARKLVGAGSVSGLVLAPLFTGPGDRMDLESWLVEQTIPIMYVERQAGTNLPRVQSVISHNAAGAELAARHLADLGHSRMAIMVQPTAPGGTERLASWRNTLTELNLPVFDHFESIMWTDPARDRLFHDVITSVRDHGVTGMFVNVDPNALALVQSCHDHGVNVPDDLSIVSYDDTMATLASPMLTAVRPPRAAVGRMAVRYLLQAVMRGDDHPTHRLSLLPRLVIRDSTAAPRE